MELIEDGEEYVVPEPPFRVQFMREFEPDGLPESWEVRDGTNSTVALCWFKSHAYLIVEALTALATAKR